ncbi:MAG: aldose 1-epimerase [Betaproteobacteria bacterium]
MGDAVLLAAGDAAVEITPAVGGVITAYTFRGRHVLRPTTDAARADRVVRGHACYPLVPYSNRIEHGRLAFRGRTHELARNFGDHPHSIHGTGWQREWNVVANDGASALIAFDHDARGDNAHAWPWPFHAWQSFALTSDDRGATLTMRIGVRNTGDEPFPFGLGWHPYFPCTADTTLGVAATGFWETDPTCIPTALVAPEGKHRFDPPRPIGATRQDNVYAGWNGRASLVDPARDLAVDIHGDSACPFLVVFIAAAGDFLAVEPVTQMTDAFNRAARGERDTGTRVLEPGMAFSCTMRISARTLP